MTKTWTLKAFAFTREPGTRQRGNEITLQEKDGETWLRIPLLKAAKIRHGRKRFTFTRQDLEDIVENWKSKITDYKVYGRVGHERKPGLVNLEQPDGYIQVEGNILMGYAKALSEEAKSIIQDQQYIYASVDLERGYQSSELAELEDVETEAETVTLSITNEVQPRKKGKTMTDVTIDKKEYDELVASKVKLEAAEQAVAAEQERVEAQKTRIAELESKVVELEQAQVEEEDQATDEATQALLEEIASLKAQAKVAKLGSIFSSAEATALKNNAAFPVVAKEAFTSLVQFGEIKNEDGTVELEAAKDVTSSAELQEWVLDWVELAVQKLPFYATSSEEEVKMENKDGEKTINGMPLSDWEEAIQKELEKVQV